VSAADWVVLVAFSLVLYHWVLYPALVHLFATFTRRKPIAGMERPPTVSVLIPAYNEEVAIAAKIRNCLRLDYPEDQLEVLVGSDASSDQTDAIVNSLDSARVRLVRLPRRSGYPSVMNRLAATAKGELLLCTDADILLDSGALRHLAAAFSDPNVGVACARYERVGRHGHHAENFYDRYESWIKNSESRLGLMVGAYGAGIMLRKHTWMDIPRDTILGDLWVGTTALARGLRVVQVQAAKAAGSTEDPAGEFSRKARIGRGSVQAFVRRPKPYMPWSGLQGWAVFSHKGLRMLFPWLLLAMFMGSAVGAINSVHDRVLLAVQLGFWLTSPLPLLPSLRPLKGLLAIQYLMLMAVALGLGAVQHVLRRGRVAPERTPRAAGPDAVRRDSIL